MTSPLVPSALVGKWLVRRKAGLLPSFGLSKSIHCNGRGVTRVLGLPLLPFRVRARPDGLGVEIRYRFLPLCDVLVPELDAWSGRGLIFGREFCRFRLVRAAAPAWPAASPMPHL
jgi:hypothetical protein